MTMGQPFPPSIHESGIPLQSVTLATVMFERPVQDLNFGDPTYNQVTINPLWSVIEWVYTKLWS